MTDTTDALDELTGDEATAEAETPTEPETPREPCLCGCGQTPTRKRSRFMPGHDATLKSALYTTIRAGRDDPEASDEVKDEAEKAEARVKEFGWPQPAVKKAKAPKAAKDGETAEGDVDVESLTEAEDGVEVEDL